MTACPASRSIRQRATLLAPLLALVLGACADAVTAGGDHDRVGLQYAADRRAAEQAAGAEAARADAPATAAAPTGAAPALNANFKSADLDVASYVDRFEGESREIAVARDAIVKALAIQPGEELADVGAGTGLFLAPFHAAVAPDGHVYAVDISTKFIEHMDQRILDEQLDRVSAVLCDDRSAQLRSNSVDVVFICDTYHHFEYPAETMASVHAALRPGGRVVIVDFERIPGVSRDWLLEHVRCGKQTVIDEVVAGGFRYDGELDVAGLGENYVLRFVKQ